MGKAGGMLSTTWPEPTKQTNGTTEYMDNRNASDTWRSPSCKATSMGPNQDWSPMLQGNQHMLQFRPGQTSLGGGPTQQHPLMAPDQFTQPHQSRFTSVPSNFNHEPQNKGDSCHMRMDNRTKGDSQHRRTYEVAS